MEERIAGAGRGVPTDVVIGVGGLTVQSDGFKRPLQIPLRQIAAVVTSGDSVHASRIYRRPVRGLVPQGSRTAANVAVVFRSPVRVADFTRKAFSSGAVMANDRRGIDVDILGLDLARPFDLARALERRGVERGPSVDAVLQDVIGNLPPEEEAAERAKRIRLVRLIAMFATITTVLMFVPASMFLRAAFERGVPAADLPVSQFLLAALCASGFLLVGYVLGRVFAPIDERADPATPGSAPNGKYLAFALALLAPFLGGIALGAIGDWPTLSAGLTVGVTAGAGLGLLHKGLFGYTHRHLLAER